MPLPIAVLVSGSGSNLQSIIDRIESGVLDAEIRLVIANEPGAFGLRRAENHGIPHQLISHRDHDSRGSFDLALVRAISQAGAEAVVLAGFMRILTSGFLNSFPGRVLNIHPALLPSFPGVHGQPDAADYGVKLAGCTVHFVDEKMDHGPVIIQAAVPAHADDDGKSLGARILKLEHRVYPQAIQWLAQDRLEIRGRKVFLRPGKGGVHPGPAAGRMLSLDEIRARARGCLSAGYSRTVLAGLSKVAEPVLAEFLDGGDIPASALVGIHNGVAALVQPDGGDYLVNPPLESGF